MNKFRYNELAYAEEIIKNQKFLTQYHKYESKILVKYFKSIGKKPKERKELLYSFFRNSIKGFNEVLYFKQINAALNVGNKQFNDLIVIKEIPVTKSEMDYINKVNLDNIHKKVVFTLLVQNKINKLVSKFIYGESSEFNYFGGKTQHYKNIFEAAKIPYYYPKVNGKMKKVNIDSIINRLDQYGIIQLRDRGKIYLSFVEVIEPCDEIEFNVTSFDNIGYFFDKYNGDTKIVNCECGTLIRLSNNKKKYCNDCALKIKYENDRRNYNLRK